MTTLFIDPANGYQQLADDRRNRAERVRIRSAALPSGLEPLRIAMNRRAAELELTAAALDEIAFGQRSNVVAA